MISAHDKQLEYGESIVDFKTNNKAIIQCYDKPNIIDGCDALNRLKHTLKYYSMFDIDRNKNDQDIFMDFMINYICVLHLTTINYVANIITSKTTNFIIHFMDQNYDQQVIRYAGLTNRH